MPKPPDKLYQVYRTETTVFLVVAGQASEATALVNDGQQAAGHAKVLRQRADVAYSVQAVYLWWGPKEVE